MDKLTDELKDFPDSHLEQWNPSLYLGVALLDTQPLDIRPLNSNIMLLDIIMNDVNSLSYAPEELEVSETRHPSRQTQSLTHSTNEAYPVSQIPAGLEPHPVMESISA
jgi:hypothetical protein